MPAVQYAPLPNRNDDEDGPDNEMDAAFESDDEQAPLTRPSDRADRALSPPPRTPAPAGTYDFEYDYPPPPGSPPPGPPTAYGNSNGVVPDSPIVRPQHQRPWYSRFAARILPTRSNATTRGSGMENDGVFANVMAKPGGTAPRPTTDGDGIHYAPETTQSDAPPSYAVAQADAVPPYWETTILAPGAFGELLVDSLPAGSFFAFAWSLLVSATFQWVGFLLAYCVASTHAGRYGARAGLGITMVQFGIFLRAKPELTDIADDGTALWPWQSEEGSPPPPSGSYPTELPGNSTVPTYPPNGAITYVQMGGFIEWLSLFTMTMGWFITFTSILGYWRVKRWENSLRASSPPAQPTNEDTTPTFSHPLEHAFSVTMLRNGLGFSAHRSRDEEEGRPDPDDSRHTVEDQQLRANFRAVGLI